MTNFLQLNEKSFLYCRNIYHFSMRFKFLLLLFFFCLNSYSQEYQFQNITTKDGLASNNINCIFKDSKGFMWFGTGDGGVSKYDGKIFTNYNTESGLSNNDVRCVFEDK